MKFWVELFTQLKNGHNACLLFVIQSDGSSPGRAGFHQFVTDHGEMFGSIGGGVMEKKLIDLAKHKMQQGAFAPFALKQVHKTNIEKDKSGMICSGEQIIAFYFLSEKNLPIIESITVDRGTHVLLHLNEKGISIKEHTIASFIEETTSDIKSWSYDHQLNARDHVTIIGGGHVSLALSECLHWIGFDISVYDDRPDLNTLNRNQFARHIELVNYEEMGERLISNPSPFIVVMTTGYRSDLVVMRQLIRSDFRYLGLLGSEEKIRKMFAELVGEGFAETELKRIHAPIGLKINSRTPEEIAISITAEIIGIRNSRI